MAKKKGKKRSSKSRRGKSRKGKDSKTSSEVDVTTLIAEEKKEESLCPECGAFVEVGSSTCPICGNPLTVAEEPPEEVVEAETEVVEEMEALPTEAEESFQSDALMMRLFEWQAKGYNTSYLEELLQEGAEDIEEKFDEFEKNIPILEEIVHELEGIETDVRLKDEVTRIRNMLDDPSKVEEIKRLVEDLKSKILINSLRDELYELDTRGFEKEVSEIEALMEKPENADKVRAMIKELRRKIKQRFFEFEIAKEFEPRPKRKLKKIKIIIRPTEEKEKEFTIEDILILHKDGTLISHLTRRTKEELEQMKLSTLTHLIQTKVRTPTPEEGISEVEYSVHKILIGKGDHLSMAVVIKGEKKEQIDPLMNKSIELLERRFLPVLQEWHGDPGVLTGIEKYVNILMEAFVKMEG